MSNYEIELQVQGSPSGELTQQVDGEPGGGSVSAREAEAWARGTRAGTAVSSDDPTYHNNSKYYAEQAHDAAESASAAYGTNLLAPTFDASQAYPAGAHVIHDGGYYVLPEGHTAGDTWAETSKTQQTVGGEVTGLKSAIDKNIDAVGKINGYLLNPFDFDIGNITIETTGWTYGSSTTRVRTKEGTTIHLLKGDTISFSSYSALRYYLGCKKSDNTYTKYGWLTADTTIAVEGDYVILIEGVPAFVVSNVQQLIGGLTIYTNNNNLKSIEKSFETVAKNINETDKDLRSLDVAIIGNLKFSKDFDIGNITISNSGWSYSDYKYRVRTKEGTTIPLKKGDTISLVDTTTAKYWWGCRDGNGNYTSSSSAVTGEYTVPQDGDFVILMEAVPVAEITDKFTLLNQLRIERPVNTANEAKRLSIKSNIKSINHRGYNTIAPENTIPAFKLSKVMGFEYVECDVQMTSDRVPVIIHDATINRTARDAGGQELSSTINIADITYEEALEYDFGIYKGSEYAGTKIPTFTQFIALCRNVGLKAYIEIKENVDFTEAEIKGLCDTVHNYGMDNSVSWICSNMTFLGYIKTYKPYARIGNLQMSFYSQNYLDTLSLKNGTNKVFVDVHTVSDGIITSLKENDIELEYWTINTASDILALNPYTTGVTSDSLIAGEVLYDYYMNN